MALLLAVFLFLLNAKHSFQESEVPLSKVIKSTAGCKNLKDCEVPKIKALALEIFPPSLRREAEIPVKIIVVMEQQTKTTDQKVGETLMNAIMIALDACSRSQKAYTSTYKRAMTTKSRAMKMIKGVQEVALSVDKKYSCVVIATLLKFSRENCQICQRMIPDFMDGQTAEKTGDVLLTSLKQKAPLYIKVYLNVIKTFAANAAAYMDKLVVCAKSGKAVESCRIKDEEGALCKRMQTIFNLGKQIMSFMSTVGTTITTEMEGFIGRVATTHKAYRDCLQSGAPASVNISDTPVETSIVDKYGEKVKGQTKPLSDVVSRALQTKLRMLRERRLQRARSLRGQRFQRR